MTLLVALAYFLVFALGLLAGWYARARSARDLQDSAKAMLSVIEGTTEYVLKAATVMHKIDGVLEQIIKAQVEGNRVLNSLDSNQAGMLNLMVNSGLMRRADLRDEVQVGQRRDKVQAPDFIPPDPDRVPPPEEKPEMR